MTSLEPIRELGLQDKQLTCNLGRDQHLLGDARPEDLVTWSRSTTGHHISYGYGLS